MSDTSSAEPPAPEVQTTQVPGQQVEHPDQVLPSTAGYEGLKDAMLPADDPRAAFPVREKKFRLREEIPAAALLDLALTGDADAPELERVRSIHTFLQVALHPDDSWDFNQYLRKASPSIEMPELVQIIEDIIARITGRPT